MSERCHFHFSLSRIGEGNGNPLQCSCLENPSDEGAWWAAVYGVAKSRTRLTWLSCSSGRNDNTFHVYDISHYSRHFCVYRFIWLSWERLSEIWSYISQMRTLTHSVFSYCSEATQAGRRPGSRRYVSWATDVLLFFLLVRTGSWMGHALFALVPRKLFWKNYIWAFLVIFIYLFACTGS